MIKMYIGLNVKYPSLLSDFDETWIIATDFRKIPNAYRSFQTFLASNTRCGAVDWSTELQAEKSRVLFPKVPFEIFIDIIRPNELRPWGVLSL